MRRPDQKSDLSRRSVSKGKQATNEHKSQPTQVETPVPPTLLPGPFGDLSDSQSTELAQRCLLSALQWMHDRAASQPEDQRTVWKKHLSAVQAAMHFIRQESSPGAGAVTVSNPRAFDPQRAKEFGEIVTAARTAAGLSQPELAQRTGLSRGTIGNVEAGRNVPAQATLLRLLAVKELGLSAEQVPWLHDVSAAFGSSPNCWIAPGYDPLSLFSELFERLNGQGGSLEQTFAYLDHKSAANWYQISNQSQYASRYRAKTPIDELARQIIDETQHAKLDVIALGSGDGKQEVRLVQHLLDWAEDRGVVCDIRLFLLDVSQPLLSAALLHAMTALEDRGVYICAVQGNFHHWPQYRQFHYANERSHRRRLICMFGNTVGNLDNESRFFQHTLVGLAPQDLLLVDLGLSYGSPNQPSQIQSRDPALSKAVPDAHVDWLAGPIWRYCKDVRNVSLSYQLDVTCQFPGAYTIDTLARVQMSNGEERSFSVFRFKRYDSQRFADTLGQIGWECVSSMPFGPDPSQPVSCALLFRRGASPASRSEVETASHHGDSAPAR